MTPSEHKAFIETELAEIEVYSAGLREHPQNGVSREVHFGDVDRLCRVVRELWAENEKLEALVEYYRALVKRWAEELEQYQYAGGLGRLTWQ